MKLLILLQSYLIYFDINVDQNLSRELAIGLALIYPISITYTALTKESKSELTNSSNNKSLPNRYIADVIDFLLLISPISTLFPFAWITGHYVYINDLDSIRKIHNLSWSNKPKTKHSNISMTRGGDGTLITSTTSLTSPFVSSTSPVTNTTTISTNTNNIDYLIILIQVDLI
ncbi:hypothetical protein RhiirC2_794218 [Rhizophagus irregularis]|uniref:Uncharacterized protein n=1 Tax=Rhizophagus irregularis TaxID=588596 RepID=A0A2N1MDX7_9GLOM|nr:hypothetical protein RhiirC2_794218 [Rhizophagus irregularis]